VDGLDLATAAKALITTVRQAISIPMMEPIHCQSVLQHTILEQSDRQAAFQPPQLSSVIL
jgi:hypothetical protein